MPVSVLVLVLTKLLAGCVQQEPPVCIERETWIRDADGDAYGTAERDEGAVVKACTRPDGYTSDGLASDCDDENPDIRPFALEKCNGIDDNCNGLVDSDDSDDMDPDTTPWQGPDEDGDGYTVELVRNTRVLACGYTPGYAALEGDCDDADANRNPGEEEVCGDGVDSDCGGADCGEMSVEDADMIFEGDKGSYAGYSVAGGHDLDGDGLDDVVIGAPWANVRGAELGAAYIVSGGTTGTIGPEDAAATIYDFWGNDSFGFFVDSMGDANGDGVGEVLVTAHAGNRVQLFLSPFERTSYADTAAATITVDSGGDYWISGVDAGDNDGDGVGDYVLSGATRAGESGVFVISGALRGTHDVEEAAVGAVIGGQAGAYLRNQQSRDLNGDGLSDILAACVECAGDASALLGVFDGPLDSDVPAESADLLITGTFLRAAAADLDGDGNLDLAVVSPPVAEGPYEVVYVYSSPGHGMLSPSDATAQVIPTEELALSGDIRPVSDLDGDGCDELLIGAPHDLPAKYPTEYGNVWLWMGQPSGVYSAYPAARLNGVGQLDQVGWSIGTLLDKSGLPGAVLGSSGAGAWIVGGERLNSLLEGG